MTDTTLQLTEAFNRHNSLYSALLGNLNTLTTAHAEEVTITLDAGKARALTRILNAAPLDGSPLYTRVNVVTDTDAWETDASKINRYLEENDLEPNLNNVAAAFIYAETEFPHMDIELRKRRMTEPITKDEILKTLKFAREIANLDGLCYLDYALNNMANEAGID